MNDAEMWQQMLNDITGYHPWRDHVERRAYQLYEDRTQRGEPGDAVNDWLRAEVEVFGDVPLVIGFEPNGTFGPFVGDSETKSYEDLLKTHFPSEAALLNEARLEPKPWPYSEEGPTAAMAVRPIPVPPLYGPHAIHFPTLEGLLSMVAAAGGVKSLVDLMKIWVEERKGRRVEMKRGEIAIVIQGGVSRREL